MSKKLSRIRLKNLADALHRAETVADRVASNEGGDLHDMASRMLNQLEEMSMEVGMLLADDEDGTKPL